MAILRFSRGAPPAANIVTSTVRQRFALAHQGLTQHHVGQVENATRQWFRITAAHPRAKLGLPSIAVEAMVREALLQSGAPPGRGASDRPKDLLHTLRLARADEGTPHLPLLFRVDREISISGARRYVADCGGRGQCYDYRSASICLAHLTGVGRPPRGNWKDPGPSPTAEIIGGYGE